MKEGIYHIPLKHNPLPGKPYNMDAAGSKDYDHHENRAVTGHNQEMDDPLHFVFALAETELSETMKEKIHGLAQVDPDWDLVPQITHDELKTPESVAQKKD